MYKKIQFLLLILFVCTNLLAQNIIYVTENGDGDYSGNSWNNAMSGSSLQNAIYALESSGGEIWVAEGTYLPQNTTEALYRCITGDKSFELKSGVALYGGFSPTNGISDMESRNPKIYETILSGDFNRDDSKTFDQYEPSQTREDNTTHVVVAEEVDNTSILDGFVVTGGNAYNGNSSLSTCYYNRGGGLFIRSTVDYESVNEERKHGPIVRNCCFRNNMASYGGGIFVWHGEEHVAEQYFIIEENEFTNNFALMGGAIYSTDNTQNNISQPNIRNNVFRNNYAKFYGGAVHIGGEVMFHSFSNFPSFTHVTTTMQREINAIVQGNQFVFNKSDYYGGALSMAGVGYENNTLFLEGNSFLGNEAANGGGGCYLFALDDYKSDGNLDVDIINNLFANNSAFNVGGGAVCLYENKSSAFLAVDLINNHIVNNSAPSGSILYYDNGSFKLQNTVMWEVDETKSVAINTFVNGVNNAALKSTNSSAIEYCAMQGIEETNGNINLANENIAKTGPNFINPTAFKGAAETDAEKIEIENANWNLNLCSPLRNKGKNEYLIENVETDILGNARVVSNLVDIGAYEISTPTRISYIENQLTTFFYPNPCNDFLKICSQHKAEIEKVEFFNQMGKLVLSERGNLKEISISHLSNGIYCVRIYKCGEIAPMSQIVQKQ